MIYQTNKKKKKENKLKKVQLSNIYIYKNLFPFNYLNQPPEITFNTYILKEKFFIFHVDDEELKS